MTVQLATPVLFFVVPRQTVWPWTEKTIVWPGTATPLLVSVAENVIDPSPSFAGATVSVVGALVIVSVCVVSELPVNPVPGA